MLDKLTKGAHYQYAFGDIAREQFHKEGVFYLDLWPMMMQNLGRMSLQSHL